MPLLASPVSGMHHTLKIPQFWPELGCSRQTTGPPPFIFRKLYLHSAAHGSRRWIVFERDGIRPLGISQLPPVMSYLMLPRGQPCSAPMDCPLPLVKTTELKALDFKLSGVGPVSKPQRPPAELHPLPPHSHQSCPLGRSWVSGVLAWMSETAPDLFVKHRASGLCLSPQITF